VSLLNHKQFRSGVILSNKKSSPIIFPRRFITSSYSLNKYLEMYDASPSTMTHIKSTCNKIFNHGVLYNVIKFSPMTAVKLDISLEKRRKAKERHDSKSYSNTCKQQYYSKIIIVCSCIFTIRY